MTAQTQAVEAAEREKFEASVKDLLVDGFDVPLDLTRADRDGQGDRLTYCERNTRKAWAVWLARAELTGAQGVVTPLNVFHQAWGDAKDAPNYNKAAFVYVSPFLEKAASRVTAPAQAEQPVAAPLQGSDTCCWQCNKFYPMAATICPRCGADNANHTTPQPVQPAHSKRQHVMDNTELARAHGAYMPENVNPGSAIVFYPAQLDAYTQAAIAAAQAAAPQPPANITLTLNPSGDHHG